MNKNRFYWKRDGQSFNRFGLFTRKRCSSSVFFFFFFNFETILKKEKRKRKKDFWSKTIFLSFFREHPRHVGEGFAHGVRDLGLGLFRGFTG